ncbi:conserved Plasmodium protein, unknown function [Plasmodium gaboni]|uniref:Asparagine-rich protein n=1 Tax=Plasmodium gaboni TaxID=647221 RepID=A0ABY1UUV7_9APIC|nr:conserved Plasmodium protein, unknown function [Plasmodium gaboni]
MRRNISILKYHIFYKYALKPTWFKEYRKNEVNVFFLFDSKRNIISGNISENKDTKIKHVEDRTLKSVKKNKNVQEEENDEDVYVLNGKPLYAQKNKKNKDEIKNKVSSLKKIKYLTNTDNLFYARLNESLSKTKKNKTDKKDIIEKKTFNNNDQIIEEIEYKNVKDEHNKEKNISSYIYSNNQNTTCVDNIKSDIYNERTTNSHKNTHKNDNVINNNNNNNKYTENIQLQNTPMFLGKFVNLANNIQINENKLHIEKKHDTLKTNNIYNSKESNEKEVNKINSNKSNNEYNEQSNDSYIEKLPNDNKNIKQDIFEVLKKINNENDKKGMQKFLNNFLLYKNNSPSNILGNFVSFYFCNILSEDLKDLKYSYYDGVKLCVNTFLNSLKELNENQISKMTNIYLEEYFLNIFRILKDNNLNFHFDNLEITNIKLLSVYNILGLIRNINGKRNIQKKKNIKKFLYQYICIDNKDVALLKSKNRIKFLSNIIKNGVTTRMHILVTLSYDLSSYDNSSSNIITKNNIKNTTMELIFENQLENPNFSIQSNETLNLKSSGWYLVDINQILNENLPYE